MGATPTVPMFDPTGQVRQIPADQASAALAAGGKSAVKIMDPTNTARWIPSDQQDAALKAGGKLAGGFTPAPAPTPAAPDDDTLTGQAAEAAQGVKKGLNETGLTAMRAIHAIPGVGDLLDKTKFGQSMQETQANAAAPTQGVAGATGYALENIAEFMAGDEALKGLSASEMLGKIQPVLKLVEKYPRLGKILDAGIRQGVVGGAQAAGHGANASDAATAGVVTGATGGAAEAILPAAYSGVKSVLEKIRPSTTEIAGETVPVLASQKPGAAKVASKAATTADAPEVVQAQQTGSQNAIQNVAQQATKDALDRVNSVRQALQPVTDPARLLEAPEGSKGFQFTLDGGPTEERQEGELLTDARKRQIDTRVVAGKGPKTLPGNIGPIEDPAKAAADTTGSHKEPVWQYLTSSRPGVDVGRSDVVGGGGQLVTSDPQLAQSALTRLEDLQDSATYKSMTPEQQSRIDTAHDSLQDQLGMYHAQDRINPHFDPVDTNAAVGNVSNFGEAADQIEASVKPIYQKLDEVSGGQFTALRNQSKAASKVMFQPTSIDAFNKAVDAKQAADDGIQDLFNRHSGQVSRGELQSANSAWRDAQVLNKLHATVEGSIKGAPKNIADSLGTNRLIRGNSLQTRLNSLLLKTPQSDIERVIGRDGLENLYRVSDLLSKPDTATKSVTAARAIGLHLLHNTTKGAIAGGALGALVGHPWEGAAAGALTEDAGRYVLRQAAINPRVGMLIDRAVRHEVSPKIFAPLIAATINQEQQHNQQSQETQP